MALLKRKNMSQTMVRDNGTFGRKIFLAHSSNDKPLVQDIFHLLREDGYRPWLDAENLVAGQHWEIEIESALKASDVVVLFLSSDGVNNAGYLHKEIAISADIALRQPEGALFIVPVLLGDVQVPSRLNHLHWLEFREQVSSIEVFIGLQKTLVKKLHEGVEVDFSDPFLKPVRSFVTKGGARGKPMPGKYLVLGQNSDGSKYFGKAEVKEGDQGLLTLRSHIGGSFHSYTEVSYDQKAHTELMAKFSPPAGFILNDNVQFEGPHTVFFAGGALYGTYMGFWEPNAFEFLIPSTNWP